MANDLVHDSQPSVNFLHQLARAVDHVEHVHPFFLVCDLVRESPASPIVGLLNLAVEARHDGPDLLVDLGDLLFGRVGGKNVDEFVLSIGHYCSFWTRRPKRGH
ncbi:MAG: hypothetical protein A3G76_02645 [Acidobacteria bacterium RIFCSPLOWO2_12_FULL_65_11]|nr:MAG: hypothetical protein A3H95_00910 [Acidobacteria bacterium RIFCSPLOWO2_02_FULL_64_15]OFW29848.1 MAG: hypothetical protein A3G76_02645 [Acidobacteria bacterium RIFCSPLOWO2_12_FULL_65_11]